MAALERSLAEATGQDGRKSGKDERAKAPAH
jgi:hypothetical protein